MWAVVFFSRGRYLTEAVPTEEQKSAEETNVVIAICVLTGTSFFLFCCSLFTISKEKVQGKSTGNMT